MASRVLDVLEDSPYIHIRTVGDSIDFGGLLGSAPIMPLREGSAKEFIARGGRIPAPLHSLKN